MVGGVLVERTVKEVVPALVNNRDKVNIFFVTLKYQQMCRWENWLEAWRSNWLRRVKRSTATWRSTRSRWCANSCVLLVIFASSLGEESGGRKEGTGTGWGGRKIWRSSGLKIIRGTSLKGPKTKPELCWHAKNLDFGHLVSLSHKLLCSPA